MAPVERAAVLLLNLPEAALAGIDLLSFTTTPKFQGIKNLPLGWHFLFASTNNSISIRHGVWFLVPGDSQDPLVLHVKKWDAVTEELVQEADESEIRRYRANLGSLWRERLTQYRQSIPRRKDNDAKGPEFDVSEDGNDTKTDWAKLTAWMRDTMLDRVLGRSKDHWILTTASSADCDLDNIPGLSEQKSNISEEKKLNFLPIDLKRTWRVGATGRERTNAARDRSWALRNLAETYCPAFGFMDVLGEFQFCFVMVLTLNNYSCLEQWKRILQLVLTSFDAMHDDGQFYALFLETLLIQLRHSQDAEGGLFDLSDEGARLLKNVLRQFERGIKRHGAPEEVVSQFSLLADYVKGELGWQLNQSILKHGIVELEDGERVELDLEDNDEDEETGEYAPTVVEIPQDLGGEQDDSIFRLSKARDEKMNGKGNGDESSPDEDDLECMDTRF